MIYFRVRLKDKEGTLFLDFNFLSFAELTEEGLDLQFSGTENVIHISRSDENFGNLLTFLELRFQCLGDVLDGVQKEQVDYNY